MLTEKEIRLYKYLINLESLINSYEEFDIEKRPFRFASVVEEINRARIDLKRNIGERLINEWINQKDDED